MRNLLVSIILVSIVRPCLANLIYPSSTPDVPRYLYNISHETPDGRVEHGIGWLSEQSAREKIQQGMNLEAYDEDNVHWLVSFGIEKLFQFAQQVHSLKQLAQFIDSQKLPPGQGLSVLPNRDLIQFYPEIGPYIVAVFGQGEHYMGTMIGESDLLIEFAQKNGWDLSILHQSEDQSNSLEANYVMETARWYLQVLDEKEKLEKQCEFAGLGQVFEECVFKDIETNFNNAIRLHTNRNIFFSFGSRQFGSIQSDQQRMRRVPTVSHHASRRVVAESPVNEVPQRSSQQKRSVQAPASGSKASSQGSLVGSLMRLPFKFPLISISLLSTAVIMHQMTNFTDMTAEYVVPAVQDALSADELPMEVNIREMVLMRLENRQELKILDQRLLISPDDGLSKINDNTIFWFDGKTEIEYLIVPADVQFSFNFEDIEVECDNLEKLCVFKIPPAFVSHTSLDVAKMQLGDINRTWYAATPEVQDVLIEGFEEVQIELLQKVCSDSILQEATDNSVNTLSAFLNQFNSELGFSYKIEKPSSANVLTSCNTSAQRLIDQINSSDTGVVQ